MNAEKIDRLLHLKNTYLEKMHVTVDALGVASFHGELDKVDDLMFDLQTYRMIIEKYDRQMTYVLTS